MSGRKAARSFSPQVRERAVRLVLEHEREQVSHWAAMVSVTARIASTAETLRKWLRLVARDRGVRAGTTTVEVEQDRSKPLERENRELRQANEILREASVYLAQAELTGPMRARAHTCPQTAGSSHDRLHR